MKIVSKSLCIIFLMISFQLYSQTFTDYKWEGDMPQSPEIPKEFLNEDAVIIKSKTFSQSIFTGSYPEIDQLATYETYEHIKFFKEDAVKEYKQLSIPKFKGRIGDFVQVKYVDIRIKKKDGKIIDLKVRDLPTAELKDGDDLYEQQDEYYIYDVVDLEVGDEMERITVIESKFPDQGRIVNLYANYPVLDASYVISVSNTVKLNGRVYNGMPVPVISDRGESRTYTWQMKNLKSVPEANAQGTIFTKELEYFVYELNLDGFRMEQSAFKVSNFSDLIMQYVSDFMEPRIRSKKKYRDFYNNLYADGAKLLEKEPADLIKLEKAYLFCDFMAKKMRNIGRLEDFERSEGIEYFLVNKKADFSNLMSIYRDFFESNGFEYYLAVGKSRFNGDFDVEYVSSTQIASYLFVFKDDGGNTFTVVPGGGLNELPSSLYGTKCLMKNITDSKSKLQSIEFGEEALTDQKNNKRLRRAEIQISENGDATIKSTLTLSGLFSFEGRNFWISAMKEDSLKHRLEKSLGNKFKSKEIIVNDVSVKNFEILNPYTFQVDYNVTVKSLFDINEGKISLKGSDWLGHNIRWISNSKKRTLDYHNALLGSDIDEMIIVFPMAVKVENLESLNKSTDNEFASYKMTVQQLKDNTIRIQSRYAVKQLTVPAGKASLQQSVNELWKKTNDSKWIFVKK